MILNSTKPESPFSEKLGYFSDLLYELVIADIKIKYKRSVLGLAWSMLNPLAQLLVYTFVFGTILPLRTPHFAASLFIGILSYSWFQQSMLMTTNAIVGNKSLVKRPGFPAAILPIVSSTSQLIHFFLALPVLVGVLLIEGLPLNGTILYIPLIVFLQFLFSLSIGYFTAAIYVKFRDIRYLLEIIFRLFFFLTPIVYSVDSVPDKYLQFYRLNPLMHFIEGYRNILIRGEVPESYPLLIILGATIFLMLLGYYSFTQSAYQFVEEI